MIKRTAWTHTLSRLLFLSVLLAFTSCESEEDKVYKSAYDASYKAHQQISFREGAKRGYTEGRKAGLAAAIEAADNGQAWELYLSLALGALLSSLMLGLVLQYSLLVVCRYSGRLPQFSTVIFVPAMKYTTAYRVFKRRRALLMEIDEQLREIAARKNVQIVKIHQLNEVIALKIQSLSSLDELSQAKLVQLAEEELEKIVAASEMKADTILHDQHSIQASTRITHPCPHCHRLIRFSLSSANETVTCPNRECGRQIRLPQIFSPDDEALPILDVND
jgi:hypothetical protein